MARKKATDELPAWITVGHRPVEGRKKRKQQKRRSPIGTIRELIAWGPNILEAVHVLDHAGVDRKKLVRLVDKALRHKRRAGRPKDREARRRWRYVVDYAANYRAAHPGAKDADAMRALATRLRDETGIESLRRPKEFAKEVRFHQKFLVRARSELSRE